MKGLILTVLQLVRVYTAFAKIATNTQLLENILKYHFFHKTLIQPLLHINPLDAGRRYTGILQPLKWRQTPVYRVCATFSTSPGPGIPGLRKHTSLARPRYTGIIF